METLNVHLRCLELLQMYAAGALVYLADFADLAALANYKNPEHQGSPCWLA